MQTKMASDTLVVKHLPKELSYDDKVSFFKECGAVDVKIIASRLKKYNLTFARFPSVQHAQQALHQLHQQEILGSYIVVEYARGRHEGLEEKEAKEWIPLIKETGTEALLKRFLDKLNCWTAGVEFRAPVPSHLRYHYPPPTPATLHNIAQQLASSPRFYTQVLHLMNKMNLPCPIGDAASNATSPCLLVDKSVEIRQPPPPPPPPPPQQSSTSESELSSEEDTLKETIPEIKPKPRKTIKRPKIVKPFKPQSVAKTKKATFGEVFEDPKSQVEPQKKLKLSKPVPSLSSSEKVEVTGFGFIHPVGPPKEAMEVDEPADVRNPMEEERLEKVTIDCISSEALAANRISEKDRAVVPVFKNYAEGAPTCRLYVKNLAKQTTEENLKFIFSKFLDQNTHDTPNMFDIRLMQEGRMKGQAFVTLQTVALAQTALAETNGYILNDKPMVVQFARSAVKN